MYIISERRNDDFCKTRIARISWAYLRILSPLSLSLQDAHEHRKKVAHLFLDSDLLEAFVEGGDEGPMLQAPSETRLWIKPR